MFKITFHGVEIQCETADETAQIAERLAGISDESRPGARSPQPGATSRWTVTRFNSFMATLADRQRKLLRDLVASPDGLTDQVLRQSLSLSNNKAFGPLLTAISRKAKKVGMGIQDVVASEKRTHADGDDFLEFKASPAFVAVARDAGGIK
jgi:hypothetical protein